MRLFLRNVGLIFLLCCLLIAMGYFLPSLYYSASDIKKSDQAFINAYQKTLPPQSSSLFKDYETHIAQKITHMVSVFVGKRNVQTFVHADLSAQIKNEEIETMLPLKDAIDSETTAQIKEEKTTKTVTKAFSKTKTYIKVTNYTVNKMTVLVFIKQPQNQTQLTFLKKNQEQIESFIKNLSGYDKNRGDIIRIVPIPVSNLSLFLAGLPLFEIKQAIAFGLICLLIIGLFLIGIPTLMRLLGTQQPLKTLYRQTSNLADNSFVEIKDINLLKKVQRICRETPDLAVAIIRKWMMESNFYTEKELFSRAHKAAILLLAIGETSLKKIFNRMSGDEVSTLTRLISCIGQVKEDEIQKVLTLFCQTLNEPSTLSTAIAPSMKETIPSTSPVEKVDLILKDVETLYIGKTVWKKLEKVPLEQIIAFLKNEYPQTIAIILYHLPNEKAGAVLTALPESLSTSVLMRLTALKYVSSEKIRKIETGVEKQFFPDTEKIPYKGYQKASEILSLLNQTSKKRLIDALSQRAPQIARHLARQIICFDDFALWSDEQIHLLIKQTPIEILTRALTNASGKTKEAFSRNIAPQVWGKMLKQLALPQTGKVKEIDEAQCFMIKKAQKIIDTGYIKRKV